MAVVWIGDTRCKSLQRAYEDDETAKTEAEHHYIIEEYGDISWLTSGAQQQLEALSLVNSGIVIMTGFFDCLNSCIWKTFKIDDIVERYLSFLTDIKDNYVGHSFYFCSVAPVESGYAIAFAEGGSVSEEDLNSKIKEFNEKIKEKCPVTFLDCHEYLTITSLNTRDGIRYSSETAKAVQAFILNKVILEGLCGGSSFFGKSRATKEDGPDPEHESFIYWRGPPVGENKCMVIKDDVVIPNCVGYAWGRFHEIIGEVPKLSTGNAGDWYANTADGYARGQEPRLGAVICWSQSGAAGHVAIVEQINDDGSIITSESGYRGKGVKYGLYSKTDGRNHFWVTTRNNTDGNWGGSAYNQVFQGFIYPPQNTVITSTSGNLYTGNRYGVTKEEMTPNAQYIWQYLGSKGWTRNAVAGMLGNMEVESMLSPCTWETANSVTSNQVTLQSDGTYKINTSEIAKIAQSLGRDNNTNVGYGLVQWTPYTKYTNWCKKNNLKFWELDSQLKRIEAEVEASEKSNWDDDIDQWISKSSKGYGLSFKEFTTSTRDAKWLAGAFVYCYERPGSVALSKREANAEYWYQVIGEFSPSILVNNTQLRVDAFKTDKVSSTEVQLSFVVNNGSSYECTLKQGDTLIKTVKDNSSEEESFEDGVKVIQFDDLKPNTEYTASLLVIGSTGSEYTEELPVTTLQDYPMSVKSISLETILTNGFKDAKNNFKLVIEAPKSLGYWKDHQHGYELQLIVNGYCVASKNIENAVDFERKDYNIADDFKYEFKIGDSVQIGVRTWVKTDTGEVLYDSPNAKTSQAVCLLNKPVIAFLNFKQD